MKTVQKQIEVMQAYIGGKTIKQTFRGNGTNGTVLKITYQEESSPKTFDWETYDYDIVEEPMIKYVLINSLGAIIYIHDDPERCKQERLKFFSSGYKIIKLVQDMDFKSE